MMGGALGETNGVDRRLVLLVDHDVESRRQATHLLELHGLEVVQASNGIAALELIQRLPESFRLVLTELDLPGVSGAVVAETLRIFRPELATLCMTRRALATVGGRRCLAKPLRGVHLQEALRNGHAIAGANGETNGATRLPRDTIARARARYETVGDLVEAALELARDVGPLEN
jgi:CheY-like chemotaxis protein